MTDHADTVREAMRHGLTVFSERDGDIYTVGCVALDALVAERDEARRELEWANEVRKAALDRHEHLCHEVKAIGARAVAAEAERDKIRDAASWLLANRGHRGEQQAWKLLADTLGDSQ